MWWEVAARLGSGVVSALCSAALRSVHSSVQRTRTRALMLMLLLTVSAAASIIGVADALVRLHARAGGSLPLEQLLLYCVLLLLAAVAACLSVGATPAQLALATSASVLCAIKCTAVLSIARAAMAATQAADVQAQHEWIHLDSEWTPSAHLLLLSLCVLLASDPAVRILGKRLHLWLDFVLVITACLFLPTGGEEGGGTATSPFGGSTGLIVRKVLFLLAANTFLYLRSRADTWLCIGLLLSDRLQQGGTEGALRLALGALHHHATGWSDFLPHAHFCMLLMAARFFAIGTAAACVLQHVAHIGAPTLGGAVAVLALLMCALEWWQHAAALGTPAGKLRLCTSIDLSMENLQRAAADMLARLGDDAIAATERARISLRSSRPQAASPTV